MYLCGKQKSIIIFLFITLIVISSCSDSKKNAAFDPVFTHAITLNNLGKRDSALKYLDSIFQDRNVPAYTRYRLHFFKQWAYYYSKNFEKSDIYLDSMLYELEQNGIANKYPVEYARALNAKGDYYSKHDDLNRAFECYYKSRVLAQAANDTCALGNQSYQLGMVTYRQKKYDEAIKHFKLSATQTHGCNNDSMDYCRVQEIYSNIGLCYSRLMKTDSAIFFYEKALDYIATNRVKYGEEINSFSEVAKGVIVGNIAKIHMFKKNYDTAEKLMLKSIAINERPGKENRDALWVKLNLAEVYGYTHNYPKMFEVLDRVRKSIDTMQGLRGSKADLEWRFITYKYFKYVDEPRAALVMLDSFQKLKDSIDVALKKYSQTDVRQLLESQETQYQNELLKKERHVNKLYLTIAIGLGIMAIAIGGLVYANYRRSRRNVRELIALNQEVNKQKMELQQTVNEKDTILHIVAHDLRDPIGGINFLARSIYERETDEILKKQLSIIDHTSRSSLLLINELVELGDTMRDTNAEERSSYDVNELMKTTVAMLEFKAREKEQQLVLALSSFPVPIYVNKEKVLRAVCNIVSNAIKFSNRGDSVYISVDTKAGGVMVSVKDNGIGIPYKMKNLVFSQFSGARRRGTDGEKSYGLGLSISRKIILDEGGKLWFESEENKGTTFYIQFPIWDS